MKKTTLISFALIVILALTSATPICADDIGIRSLLKDPFPDGKNSVSLEGRLNFAHDPKSINKDLYGLSLSLNLNVLPSFYILLSDSFSRSTMSSINPIKRFSNSASLDFIYLLGNSLAFQLELGLNTSGREFSTATNTFNCAVTAEYLFLNKPTYQIGASLRASNRQAYLELLGGYDITPTLHLSTDSGVTYEYNAGNININSSVSISYQDYIKATLSYSRYNLNNVETVTYSAKDSLSLNLKGGKIPLFKNLSAFYSATFYVSNLILSSAKTRFRVFGSLGVKYYFTDDFSLKLSYTLNQVNGTMTSGNPPVTTYTHYFTHRFNLGIGYEF